MSGSKVRGRKAYKWAFCCYGFKFYSVDFSSLELTEGLWTDKFSTSISRDLTFLMWAFIYLKASECDIICKLLF